MDTMNDFFETQDNIISKNHSKKIFKNNEIKYSSVIEIPKINLKRGLFDIDSKYNSVNYGIEILKESTMPDKENSNLILAGHSGNSRISYFKNLNKLVIGDEIIIYYNNNLYTYRVSEIYEINKTGTINLTDKNKSVITLITCRYNTNNQIIIIGDYILKLN